MEIIDFILLALATYYTATILADDLISGPANVLTKLRERLGLRYDDYGQPSAPPGSLAELISCTYCNSIWIGLIFTAIYGGLLDAGYYPVWLFAPLAAAGFVVAVQELKN